MLPRMLPDLAVFATGANSIVAFAFDVSFKRLEAVEFVESEFELVLETLFEFVFVEVEVEAGPVVVFVVEFVVELVAGAAGVAGTVGTGFGISVAAVQVGSQRALSTFGGQKHLPAIQSPTPPQLLTPHI